MSALDVGAWDVAMIDPPWPQRKGGRRAVRPHQGADLEYPTMPVGEIFALLDREILSAAAPGHAVFLWVIDKYLVPAEAEMERRGYRRHARLVWDKENGVAPAFTVRFCHEYLIWYYQPPLTPIAPERRGAFSTVLRERSRQHSRKPDAAYALVGALYPAARRIDVFSREARDGWAQWGNQTDHFPMNGAA